MDPLERQQLEAEQERLRRELLRYGFDVTTGKDVDPSWWQFNPADTAFDAANKWVNVFGQGATLGFADELAAAASTGLGKVGIGPGGSYAENLAAIRGTVDEAIAERPGASLLANVVGGIPSAMVTPSVKGAMALGGLTGIGMGEDAGGRALGGAFGGALGGAGQLLGNAASKLVGKVVGGVNELLPAGATPATRRPEAGVLGIGKKGAILSPGERYLAEEATRRGLTSDLVGEAITRQTQAVDEGQAVQILAEALDNAGMSNLAAYQAQVPASKSIAGDVLRGRTAGARQRIGGFLDVLSPEASPLEGGIMARNAMRELDFAGSQKTNELARQLYDQLNWTGIPTEKISEILQTPAAQKITAQAFEAMPGGAPENMGLREIKKIASAAGKVGHAKSFANAGPENVLTAENAALIGRQLDDELRSVVAGLADADKAYPGVITSGYGGMGEPARGLMDTIGAIKDKGVAAGPGRAMLQSQPEVVQQVLQGADTLGIESARPGLRAAMRGMIDEDMSKRQGMSLLNSPLGKGTKQRDIVEVLMGDTAATDKLGRQMEREIAFRQLENKALSPSQTASFLEEGARAKGLLQKIRAYVQNPMSAAGDAILSGFDDFFDDAMKREITSILYSQGMDAANKLKRLQPYMTRLERIQQATEAMAKTGKVTGAQLGRLNAYFEDR